MLSYLTCVDAAVEPGADHVAGDVGAEDFWLPAGAVRDQSHSALLQAGVTLRLCQTKEIN